MPAPPLFSETTDAETVARHLSTKTTLLPLLHAWTEAGIDALIFKGFYLAEFVYPDADNRPYGDVDVLLKPAQMLAARQTAQELGWSELWHRKDSLYHFNHEESNLFYGGVMLEPHRYILDTLAPWDALQRRFTRAAWAATHTVAWEGVKLQTLAPADSILMGLVLARSWSAGDNWTLHESDYQDFQQLSKHLSLEDVRARARALHCSRTLELFLARCNPWENRFDTSKPSTLQRQLWHLKVVPERGHLGAERALMSLARLPGTAFDTLRFLPQVTALRTRDLAEPETALAIPNGTRPAALSQKVKERIVRGVKWSAGLLWPWGDACALRSVALFNALSRAGFPVRFHMGKDASGKRHARISIRDTSLRDLEGTQTCDLITSLKTVEAYSVSEEAAHPAPLGDAMSALLDDGTLLTASPSQVSTETENETIILDPRSGAYFSLDAVGAEVWKRVQSPLSFAQLKADLLELYDVPEDVLEPDLRALISELAKARLLNLKHAS